MKLVNMETVKQYDTAFSTAKEKLVKLAENFERQDYLRIALATNMSDTSIISYCNGNGTNLKTTLEIIECIENGFQ